MLLGRYIYIFFALKKLAADSFHIRIIYTRIEKSYMTRHSCPQKTSCRAGDCLSDPLEDKARDHWLEGQGPRATQTFLKGDYLGSGNHMGAFVFIKVVFRAEPFNLTGDRNMTKK